IEDFTVIEPFADFASAHALGAHRMPLLDPIDYIQIMDVLLDNVVAAKPGKVIPITHLIFHFGQLVAAFLLELGAAMKPGRLSIPITAHRDNVSNRAVMQALKRFHITIVIMALQADNYFERLLLRLLGCRQKPAHARRVGGYWFLGEDVFSLLDGFLEMVWPE